MAKTGNRELDVSYLLSKRIKKSHQLPNIITTPELCTFSRLAPAMMAITAYNPNMVIACSRTHLLNLKSKHEDLALSGKLGKRCLSSGAGTLLIASQGRNPANKVLCFDIWTILSQRHPFTLSISVQSIWLDANLGIDPNSGQFSESHDVRRKKSHYLLAYVRC